MKTPDPWIDLRSGKMDEGLKVFKKNFSREPDASHIMELGVAFLWLKQYVDASDHFSESIKKYSDSMSSFYGMAGVSKWCQNDNAESIQLWQNGLKAEFADTNGLGVKLPLLLYTASVLRPSLFEKATALELLKKKARDRRIRSWPGPIALWLIAEIDESELHSQSSSSNKVDFNNRQWLISFYKGVLLFRAGMQTEFKNAMRELSDTHRPNWKDHNFFLARMWSEEFFLARHEAELNSTRQP